MIAVVYTGLPRFGDQTFENHKLLIDNLSQLFEVVTYNFTTTNFRLNCPFDPLDSEVRGNLQCWDFADSLEKISQSIIIKLRTDLVLTPSSIRVIIKEVTKIVYGENSVAFLGLEVKRHYSEECVLEKVSSAVLDFVIVAHRNKINSSIEIKQLLVKNKYAWGHHAFINLIKEHDVAFNVHSRIFIIRKEYDKIANWEWMAFEDYFLSRPFKKVRNALEWLHSASRNFEDL